ncbi:hypothetical protein LQK89_02750 [Curtobacterium sp. C1]|uniref:hypothetical protein n=1 Tax=Curtobacterium sp. C1 TaxID=2898151 RepID=UPI001E60C80D|nr:hypothetical protein [Curtobacterium sp. C1]UFU14638.1 hypothetical protein LQK89_02750 [Curtobacterium sp. C1]
MATRKSTTTTRKAATTPGPKTEDLTTLKLPGGGVATFYKPGELTPRRERPLTILNAHLMPKFQEAFRAAGIVDPTKLGPFDLSLSIEDTEKIIHLQELAAVAYLKGWTKAEPVPTEADELLDLPRPLYDALVGHAAKIQASSLVNMFTVDAVEDPDSPTGGSDA